MNAFTLSATLPFRTFSPHGTPPRYFVSGEGLAQDVHQRTVAGEIDSWRGSVLATPGGDVKPTSVLPAPGTPVTKQITFRP